MTNDSIPSHVPEESRKEITNYLRRVTAGWVKSDNSTIHHSDDDKIFSAFTQTSRKDLKKSKRKWLEINGWRRTLRTP